MTAAFLYAGEPETSTWTFAHEQGRRELEKALGESVTTGVYLLAPDSDGEAEMEQAIGDGAKVLFATAPTMDRLYQKLVALTDALRGAGDLPQAESLFPAVKTEYQHICTFLTAQK